MSRHFIEGGKEVKTGGLVLEHLEYKAASGCLLATSVSPTISYSKESFVYGQVPYIAEKSPTSDEYSSPDNSSSEENNVVPSVQKKQLVSDVNDRRLRGTKSCLKKVEQTISKGKSAQYKLEPIDNLSTPNYELQRHRFRGEHGNTSWKKNILLRHRSDVTKDPMSVKLQQGMINSFAAGSGMTASIGSFPGHLGLQTKERINEHTSVTPAPTYSPPPSSLSCVHYTTSVHDCTASMMPCKFQGVCAADVQAPQFHVPLPEIIPALPVSSGSQPIVIPTSFMYPSTKFVKPSTSVRSDTVPFPRVRSAQKKVTSD